MYENLAATLHTFLNPLSLSIKEKCHWHVTEIVCIPAQYSFRWNFAIIGSLGGSFPYEYTIYLCMCETASAQALPLIHGRQRLIV